MAYATSGLKRRNLLRSEASRIVFLRVVHFVFIFFPELGILCCNNDECPSKNVMDTLGIEPNTSRMLSERDNQLHHVPGLFTNATRQLYGQPVLQCTDAHRRCVSKKAFCNVLPNLMDPLRIENLPEQPLGYE